MSITDDIRSILTDPAETPETTAQKIVSRLNTVDAEYFYPVVRAAAVFENRNMTRLAESAIDLLKTPRPTSVLPRVYSDSEKREVINEANARVKDAISDLMNRPFTYIMNGETFKVTWGSATIEQHAFRIQYLAAKANGINMTIGRHQAVIDLIRSQSKTSLSECDLSNVQVEDLTVEEEAVMV